MIIRIITPISSLFSWHCRQCYPACCMLGPIFARVPLNWCKCSKDFTKAVCMQRHGSCIYITVLYSFTYCWQRSTHWDPLPQAALQPVSSSRCPAWPRRVWAVHTGETPLGCSSSAWRSWMSDCHCKETNVELVNSVCAPAGQCQHSYGSRCFRRVFTVQGCFLACLCSSSCRKASGGNIRAEIKLWWCAINATIVLKKSICPLEFGSFAWLCNQSHVNRVMLILQLVQHTGSVTASDSFIFVRSSKLALQTVSDQRRCKRWLMLRLTCPVSSELTNILLRKRFRYGAC